MESWMPAAMALQRRKRTADVEVLFSELTTEDRLDPPMPPDTRMGHFHLYVADLDKTMHFYHTLLGFDDMGLARTFRMGMVSAGRYHHHIGFNTWLGEGTPSPPPDALGIRYFSFVLPNETELERVVEHVQQAGVATEQTDEGIWIRDPSGIRLVLGASARTKIISG
jgi:catechol 2,3-dioxygenase